ncbi:type I site-specific deoxyribonuclease specificity subunit [Paucilactobacillus vaccinostercus DSM 20634]|uniref:Type I site-specific deoxyribonuclease specificity subunit n=1 Tax=Paucilactobacillus vaccinostercus DSM 20634 TaxID=1423813 RepID=A0A0R2A1K3_9LACO|nr:restriction endonuclease subunit S [Paucilactobacillus vaccinostercus]KRM60848.1 type I site-specific deoxyribonuclease specificity subunit [Paucilactobacillus vaccinostercus DSM 20634]
MSEKNVPNVRFEGFSESWEQRKLSNLFKVQSRQVKLEDSESYQLVTVKRRNGGIVSRGMFLGQQILVKSQYRVLSGDFLISKRQVVHGATGIVPKKLDGAVVSNEYLVLRGNNLLNTDFFRIVSERPEMYKLYFLSSYGIDIEKLVFNVKTWMKKSILLPNTIEQSKIETLVCKIDFLIASNQHKLDQLKEVKKLLMQKIFDQEWRFEGFTDPWEQRQLGKIVDERKERSSQGELLSVTMHDGIKKSSTLGKKDNSSDNKSNYKVVCQGDIAYNSMRMWQGASGLSMFNGIVSPAYTVLKIGTSIDGSFLSYLFKRSEMIWMFRTHSQGLTSDTWNLKYPALSKIKIEYPILNEQIRISTFLKNFDQLIASNQQKLDQLKELKKWFMQNMFV